MTTQPFVRPGEPVRRHPPVAERSRSTHRSLRRSRRRAACGASCLPITLVVGVVGFIVAMYVTGMRSFAHGFGIFGVMMLVGMVGMLFRGRGARPAHVAGAS